MVVRGRFDTSNRDARPWLYGIAKNVIKDLKRREPLAKLESLVVSPEYLGADPYDVDDRLVAGEAAARTQELLRRLPPGQREALLMSAVEGLTYAEIADIQGVSPQTVGSRIHRARRRCQRALTNPWAEEGWEGDPSREAER